LDSNFARSAVLHAGDFFDGDFHPQRASFDFNRGAIEAAKDDRLAETADVDSCSRH